MAPFQIEFLRQTKIVLFSSAAHLKLKKKKGKIVGVND